MAKKKQVAGSAKAASGKRSPAAAKPTPKKSPHSGGRLRFATLIRVSTEKQERRGESLKTQARQLEQAVESLDGQIVARYEGQEHATPGAERLRLQKLIRDAQRPDRPFDAVIVADASRWSRDNAESKQHLAILRERGIRFFVLTTEYDLTNPEQMLFLGLSAEIGEFHARTQSQKSLLNRIARARKGIPTAGKSPYGRIWNGEDWCLDEAKARTIQAIANRYLAGESLPDLATEFGMNHSFLHSVLRGSCGRSWTIDFDSDVLNIHESVEFEIPELLPQKTIDAIRAQMEANRTFQHGKPKHPYLLSGFVFCALCDYTMFGQTNPTGKAYYRHAHTKRDRPCSIRPRPWVSRDELEHAVITRLLETFGSGDFMERAIKAALPNGKDIEKLLREQKEIEGDISQVTEAKQRILRLIASGKVTEQEAHDEIDKLNERLTKLKGRLDSVSRSLAHVPTEEEQSDAASKARRWLASWNNGKGTARRRSARRRAQEVELTSWDQKRKLVELVFAGRRIDGRPNGVYVEPIPGQTNHRKKRWGFVLFGIGRWAEEGVAGELVTQSSLYSPSKAPPALRFPAPPRPLRE